jgi:hypothetical protein
MLQSGEKCIKLRLTTTRQGKRSSHEALVGFPDGDSAHASQVIGRLVPMGSWFFLFPSAWKCLVFAGLLHFLYLLPNMTPVFLRFFCGSTNRDLVFLVENAVFCAD